MSNYLQYQKARDKREADLAKRDALLAIFPAEVVEAIKAREGAAIQVRAGMKKIKADEILLILEHHGVDVTESIFNEVQSVYG